jgi:DegV family protein with EDD domain
LSTFFIDSNSELWFDKAEALGVSFISMPYTLDGVEYYYDLGKNTDFKHFYKRVREGAIPTTSALNAQNYIDIFKPYLQKGEDILYLTFSHKMSATFEFCDIAIEKLKAEFPERKIIVFDSNAISVPCALQCIYAAETFNKNRSIPETIEFLKDFTKHAGCYFVVDDLNHLKRGGRISGAAAVVGTLLGVKPLLTISITGAIENIGKIKGGKKVVSTLVDLIKTNGDFSVYKRILLTNADCENQAKELAAALKAALPADIEISSQTVGPVIASHCGPGTVGVGFYLKKCR